MSAVSCPHGDESFIVADYLTGRLSEAEVSAFEEHSLGCDRCFGELERAAELRAAETRERAAETGERPAAPVRSARPAALAWPALGLAATILVAVGLWMAQPLMDSPQSATEPVYRDAGDATGLPDTLGLTVARENDQVTLKWPPVDGADLYEVRVLTEAGDPVFEQQSEATSLELSVAAWRESAPAGQYYAQVIALDELRQALVRSDFEPL